MKIAEYAVKNYQLTLLMFILVIALGVTSILTMPRAEDPELSSPEFPVIVVYPGTSPKDLEDLVVDPIEEKLNGLENISKVNANISDGLAVVYVKYKHGSDVDTKYQELIREVNNLRNELPKDIYSIEIKKWLPSNVNIIQTALISETAPYDKMKEYAEMLKEDLEKIPQMKNIQIQGLPDKIVRIELNTEKCSAMHIPYDAVIGAVQSQSVTIPGGNVYGGTKSFNLKTAGGYTTLDEIKNTVVWSAAGKNILLGDVASVYFDYDQQKHITRLNGHRALFVVGAQKPGENITETQKEYQPVFESFKKKLPADIAMVQHFDQADNVNKRLKGLGIDFLIAIGLVAFTLLPLGNRAAIIVMISIPLSLAIGIFLMDTLGYTLNQLSIVGLVVALGLLVDDSIVVVENIERWLREGHNPVEAAILATKQIGLAVIGCTATLVIAFLPLVFLPAASGDFIRSLPMGVITTVVSSMVVSLTIVPFLSSKILKAHAGHPDGNIFLRSLKKIISASYSRLLDKALERPVITAVTALVIFGASLLLVPVVGFSLFPASEKPQFLVEIRTPMQSNIEYTDKITREIESELKQHKEVRYFASNTGKGNPQIYYNIIQETGSADYAQIFVQLDEHTTTAVKLGLIDELRKKWTPYPGARIEVKNFEQGPPVVAPVEVRLFGNNLDTLRRIAGDAEEMLKKQEGTIYVNNPGSNLKTDIKIAVNKEKAGMLGIPVVNINKTIRFAATGFESGKLTDDKGKSYAIQISGAKENRNSLEALENLYVNTYSGSAVPLRQVAELQLEASPLNIHHQNKVRTMSVSAYVKKGYLNDNINREVTEKMKSFPLPAGYTFEMGGELEARKESFGGFGSVIIITIFLFITVLVLEFRTFKSTLIVLSVIPLGIVGAVLALLITGNSLSFVAVIGLIALAGVEVKNTILLVDFTNQLRKEGKTLDEAIREAGEIRFLPIILTSLTAIGGLMPIALSSNPLIAPLAIVIIGGLISSTLLSRIVTPVVYKLIPPFV